MHILTDHDIESVEKNPFINSYTINSDHMCVVVIPYYSFEGELHNILIRQIAFLSTKFIAFDL